MGLLSNTNNGFLIAIEGIDGSGKTTLVTKLKNALIKSGYKVISLKEPGNNVVGDLHRRLASFREVDPYCAALISTADRYFKNKFVQKKLEQGFMVLSDRYYLSGLAYHYVDGISFEEYAYLNRNVVKPHIYIFLKINLDIALSRIKKPRDRWENIIDKVYYAYFNAIRFIKQKEKAVVYEINANEHIDSVYQSALEILKREGIIL